MNDNKLRLLIEPITESKAKFLKFPLKSFVDREKYEFSFRIKNIGSIAFNGGTLTCVIKYSIPHELIESFSIKPLKLGETTETESFLTEALSSGFGLFLIRDFHTDGHKKSETELFKGKITESGYTIEDKINPKFSFHSIKIKTWEEIIGFWALMIATISLSIIAFEKIIGLLNWLGC